MTSGLLLATGAGRCMERRLHPCPADPRRRLPGDRRRAGAPLAGGVEPRGVRPDRVPGFRGKSARFGCAARPPLGEGRPRSAAPRRGRGPFLDPLPPARGSSAALSVPRPVHRVVHDRAGPRRVPWLGQEAPAGVPPIDGDASRRGGRRSRPPSSRERLLRRSHRFLFGESRGIRAPCRRPCAALGQGPPPAPAPENLRPRPHRENERRDPPPLASFVLVSTAVLVVAAIGILRSVPLPTPLPVPGARDFSFESLSLLSRESRAQRPPDVSDLAAHEAYQETLAFGRPWGLPARDERVYVREFSANPRTGTIVRSAAGEGLRCRVAGRAFSQPARGKHRGASRQPAPADGRCDPRAGEEPPSRAAGRLDGAVRLLGVVRVERRTTPLMRSVLLRFNGAARRNQTP